MEIGETTNDWSEYSSLPLTHSSEMCLLSQIWESSFSRGTWLPFSGTFNWKKLSSLKKELSPQPCLPSSRASPKSMILSLSTFPHPPCPIDDAVEDVEIFLSSAAWWPPEADPPPPPPTRLEFSLSARGGGETRTTFWGRGPRMMSTQSNWTEWRVLPNNRINTDLIWFVSSIGQGPNSPFYGQNNPITVTVESGSFKTSTKSNTVSHRIR